MPDLARTDAVLKAIGGQISDADARRLILKKIYDIARAELDRYLNEENRVVVRARRESVGEVRRVSPTPLESDRRADHDRTRLDSFLDGPKVPVMKAS